MRQQLTETLLRMVVDPEQDVGEVSLGVHVMPLAHRDERVEDHETSAGFFGPKKE